MIKRIPKMKELQKLTKESPKIEGKRKEEISETQ
jgi:hypothetical protein